jgi:hypothetical protein
MRHRVNIRRFRCGNDADLRCQKRMRFLDCPGLVSRHPCLQHGCSPRVAADLRDRDTVRSLLQDERLPRVRKRRCLHRLPSSQPRDATADNFSSERSGLRGSEHHFSDHVACRCHAAEQVLVEASVAEAAVQALDEAVRGRPARRDSVLRDAVVLLPLQDRARRQFGAVVGRSSAASPALGQGRPPATPPACRTATCQRLAPGTRG